MNSIISPYPYRVLQLRIFDSSAASRGLVQFDSE